MKRILGFTTLALAVTAFSGTAIGLPGGEPDPIATVPSVQRLEILRCIGFQYMRVGMHNATSEPLFGDLFVEPREPLQASRKQFSSYLPVGLDRDVPVRVSVPKDAPLGDYEVGYRIGNTQQATTPVTVVDDPASQCIPRERMTATATSHQASDFAENALDGDMTTIWRSVRGALPQSITIDLGGTYDFTELRYQSRFDGALNGNLMGYTLAVSSDGTTWTDALVGTWPNVEGMKSARLATPAHNVRQIRLTVTRSYGSVAWVPELIPMGTPVHVDAPGSAGGSVPATLGFTLGAQASFGAFQPGVARTYEASTSANVVSTAGDATLSASGPLNLRNGAFSLAEPLQVELSRATWSAPASNDPVAIVFRQPIGASEPLRTGAYSGTVTFTLATSNP